jgi:hypothetical protein
MGGDYQPQTPKDEYMDVEDQEPETEETGDDNPSWYPASGFHVNTMAGQDRYKKPVNPRVSQG